MAQNINFFDLKNPIPSDQGGSFPFILDDTTLGTEYVYSVPFESGRASSTDFFINIVIGDESDIGTVTFKLEVSYDGNLWAPCQTIRQDTNVSAFEHAITVTSNSITNLYLTTKTTRGVNFCRVAIKTDGNPGTGDTVTTNSTYY